MPLRALPSSGSRSSTIRSGWARPATWRLTGSSGAGAERPEARLAARAQQPARGAIGEGRLADPLGADEQPGVVQPAALQGVQEGALVGFLAGPVERLAGMRRRRGHGGPMRLFTQPQTAAATVASSREASISTQRSGSRSAMARKAARRRSWKSSALGLEPRLGPAPPGRAHQAHLGGQVEDQGQVGPQSRPARPFQGLDQRLWRAAAGALVGARGVGEAVADHPVAPRARAGAITVSMWSRRAAYISSVSVIGDQRSASPVTSSARIASAPGEPPGSRVTSTSRPVLVQTLGEAAEPGSTCRPPPRLRR